MKRYKITRMPVEADLNFKKKNQSIQEMIAKDLNLKKKFHNTDTLKFFAQKKVMVYPEEVLSYLNNKKRKNKFNPIQI